MTARKKAVPAAERQTKPISYRILPYFAVAVDDEKLTGIRGVGETPFEAIIKMRGAIRARYPFAEFDLDESISNPEFIEGWKMPEPF